MLDDDDIKSEVRAVPKTTFRIEASPLSGESIDKDVSSSFFLQVDRRR